MMNNKKSGAMQNAQVKAIVKQFRDINPATINGSVGEGNVVVTAPDGDEVFRALRKGGSGTPWIASWDTEVLS